MEDDYFSIDAILAENQVGGRPSSAWKLILTRTRRKSDAVSKSTSRTWVISVEGENAMQAFQVKSTRFSLTDVL
jgi:hypothetical protein